MLGSSVLSGANCFYCAAAASLQLSFKLAAVNFAHCLLLTGQRGKLLVVVQANCATTAQKGTLGTLKIIRRRQNRFKDSCCSVECCYFWSCTLFFSCSSGVHVVANYREYYCCLVLFWFVSTLACWLAALVDCGDLLLLLT